MLNKFYKIDTGLQALTICFLSILTNHLSDYSKTLLTSTNTNVVLIGSVLIVFCFLIQLTIITVGGFVIFKSIKDKPKKN